MVDPDVPPRDPRLLDELQAIRELLNDRDNAGVPLLRDVVTPGAVPLLNLNDIFEELASSHPQPELDEIGRQAAEFMEAQRHALDDQPLFTDDPAADNVPDQRVVADHQIVSGQWAAEEVAPVASDAAEAAAPQPRQPRDDWQRELLIQEVVDDFVPHIEAALRRRLLAIDSDTLRRWLKE